MRRLLSATAVTVLMLALGASGASAQAPGQALSAENVEFVKNVVRHSDTAGAVLHDGYYYITTERDLSIYDVKDPLNPVLAGNVVFENPGMPVFTEEDPTTNGKILVVSNDFLGTGAQPDLMVFDVSTKTAPKLLSTLPDFEQHTTQCVLDCTWVYGSEGAIADLRDPKNPKLIGRSWRDDLGVEVTSTHDVTEVRPGILVTSTEPLLMLDAREDPAHPKVLATGKTPGFAHANLWPHGGTDDFLLVGGEATGPGCAEDPSATFMTFGTKNVLSGKTFDLIDQFRVPTGTVSDGHMVDSSFCVHWFAPHPTYANGGLVAIAWYEQGTRFLKIDQAGKISEIGHFIAAATQASDVDWITPEVAYISDYLRGLDIVKFTGPVPPGFPKPAITTTPAAPGGPLAPPPGAAAPAKVSFSAVASMPSERRCLPATGLRARIRSHASDPVVSATLKVGGRRVARATSPRALARGLRTGRLRAGRRVTVALSVRTQRGAGAASTRTYKVCAPRRSR